MPAKTWVFASEAVEDESLRLLRGEAVEALSRLFEVTVELQAIGDEDVVHANLDALLAAPAHVASSGMAGERVCGVLRSIELVTPVGRPRPIYRAVLVPRLWYATQMHRSRVFQNASVPEIAAMVFTGLGLRPDDDFRAALSTSYPKREYVVQYEETDYAFVSRLLEDEGIAFHFDHGVEREVIVLTDSNGAGMRRPHWRPRVPYRESAFAEGEEVVFGLTHERRVVPRDVLLADYDWRKPAVSLVSLARVDKHGRGLFFSGAQHYRDGDYGKRIAAIRAEELRVGREVFRGRSTIPDLRPGDVFTLDMMATAHDRSEVSGEYLVIEVKRRIDQRFDQRGPDDERERGDTFVAIRADVTYRPPRTTPKPRIDGVVYATIDGPGLDIPAPIDDEGRYKVILPFDLAAEEGGRASRWIRMAQPTSGAGYGMHFPLRPGTEVILTHVHGDPDRPIIAGAVPNAQTPSPVTSANATQSVMRTSTGITLEFEDDA
jgi:type VI secretion system secreted protein VgrG